MFDSFQRTLDRELGPAGGAQGAPPARDSWLRDWPLLLGLVVSAALIVVSTMVSGSHARPSGQIAPKEATAAGGAVPGEVVDVGPAEAPEEPKAKKAKKAKRSAATPKATPAQTGTSADTAPADEPEAAASAGGGSGGGSSSTPRRSPSRSTGNGSGGRNGGAATPGRIVNVTGTSAAFTNGPLSYAFSAPTHTPTVGQRWRLSIAVKRSGAPLQGNVRIDILHNGSVVGHAASGKLKGGKFAHDFDWPERSVGHPLTVKTTVVGGGFQQSFLFSVKIKSAG
jgi:hypothetical protein